MSLHPTIPAREAYSPHHGADPETARAAIFAAEIIATIIAFNGTRCPVRKVRLLRSHRRDARGGWKDLHHCGTHRLLASETAGTAHPIMAQVSRHARANGLAYGQVAVYVRDEVIDLGDIDVRTEEGRVAARRLRVIG